MYMLTISVPITVSKQQLMMVYLPCGQDSGEWFMVCNQHKRSSIEILMEFLYSINKFFLNLRSVAVRVCEAKATGYSIPS